mgnify:CR=1 FL=1
MAMMTSYNLINGVHAANNYDICTKAARDEWGFAGAIMTDWTTTTDSTAGECTAAGCMKAGNDMVMPGGSCEHPSGIEGWNAGYPGTETLCISYDKNHFAVQSV